jgi:hypothetical protein
MSSKLTRLLFDVRRFQVRKADIERERART